jgi:cell division protein FtsL
VKRAGSKNARRSSAAYDVYVTFLVLLTALGALALGRVWLSAEAAEASIASSKLRTEIKAARFEGDMLEIQASRLATPSRIEAIAGGAMGMAAPTSVTYMNVAPANPAARSAEQKPTGRGLKGAVASAMSMAAGEAEVLLVGDVGLATSR